MKLLLLCKKFPYPLRDGESIAVSNLCRELQSQGCEITLLAMNTSKHYTDPASIPAEFNYYHAIHTVDLDNAVKPWKAIASMVSGESYHIRRFKSSVYRTKLIEVLQAETFDIVQLETLYLAPYVNTIREYSDARVVMRAHNVEHEIWERITHRSGSYLRKWYLNYLTKQLRDYEIGQFPVYDYLVTLTERDLALFRNKGYTNGASAAPIGLSPDMYRYVSMQQDCQPSLCFIGSLDWMPNYEGLQWFLTHCWPQIHQQWPQLRFHVAGRNTPESFLRLKIPGVIMHGEVPDAVEFLSQHGMMIVPLFSGSGMRVKIVEGMMMGKVVITTTIGREGIEGEHGVDLLVADTAAEFIRFIHACMTSPDMIEDIGENAKRKASTQFDSKAVASQMMDIYHRLLRQSPHHKIRTSKPKV